MKLWKLIMIIRTIVARSRSYSEINIIGKGFKESNNKHIKFRNDPRMVENNNLQLVSSNKELNKLVTIF